MRLPSGFMYLLSIVGQFCKVRNRQTKIMSWTDYIDKGLSEGAELVVGGGTLAGDFENGYFVQPTVFSAVHNDMVIAKEENFGPVVAAMPFDDIEDVIERVNKSTYGLTARWAVMRWNNIQK